MPGRLLKKGTLLRKGSLLGSMVALVAGIMSGSAMTAMSASGATVAAPAGTLPLLPAGLNVAIGAKATANSGSAPGSSLGNLDDGDGTTRWCPGTLAIHTVTLDLGRTVNVSGTGVTFSGEEGSDGSFYSIKAGIKRSDQTLLPNQASGARTPIAGGPLY